MAKNEAAINETSELAEKYYQIALTDYEFQADDLPLREKAKRAALYQKAEEYYLKALEIDPEHEMAWISLGLIYFEDLDKPEAALDAFQRALEIDPRNQATRCKIGKVLLTLGRVKEALNVFDELMQNFQSYLERDECNPRIASKFASDLIDTARFCCKHGAPETALQLYAHVTQMEFAPEDYKEDWSYERGSDVVFKTRKRAYVRMGIPLLLLGKEDEAAQYLASATEIEDDDLGLYEDLGDAFQELGRINDAITAYERALGVLNQIYESSGLRIMDDHLQAKLDQLQPQRRRPSKRMEAPNPESEEHYNRAIELIQADKYKEAAGELLLAVKSARNRFPDAHYLLGLIYDDIG
jgi:tetratricopeptide (TPR) repeat protein